jgi:putative SOS response-associated peptidase YedK
MCGRYGLTRYPGKLLERLEAERRGRSFVPRYNIAPTQPVMAVLNDGRRSLAELRWGLIPRSAESLASIPISTINARIERIAAAPLYRDALRTRRCAIPADGFYEWRRNPDGSKTPIWIERRDREPFAFAGLWDVWTSPATGEDVRSCTIVTQPANELLASVHERMPVVLAPEAMSAWLSPDPRDASELLPLLAPAPAGDWAMHPVSKRVNAVRNDAPDLIEPVDLPTQEELDFSEL